MTFELPLVAAFVTVLWGSLVLWSNPGRRLNRVAFSMALHVALWLVFRHLASASSNGNLWFRITFGTGALIPAHLWLFLDSIVHPKDPYRSVARRGLPWALSAVVSVIFVFTEWFIPTNEDEKGKGGLFYLPHGILIISYIWLIWQARRAAKKKGGIERLEVNVILVGGASAGIITLITNLLQGAFNLRLPAFTSVLIIFTFFILLSIAVTTHRIFDARHLFIISVRTLLVVTVVSLASLQVFTLSGMFVDESVAFLASMLCVMSIYGSVNSIFSKMLKLNPKVSESRKAAFEVSRQIIRVDNLDKAFSAVLRSWAQSETATIYGRAVESNNSTDGLFAGRDSVYSTLRETKWATPERLQRERSTIKRDEVGDFLRENRFGIAVCCESSVSTLIVCVGERASRRPFTYPEVEELLELGAIFEASYSRCYLATKAHRAERLATVGVLGASVAHEIRNPLVTIKAFVQLLPIHYANDAFRERFSRLMGQEVARIERLTEQLLDLAAPRKYVTQPLALHAILNDSLELITARAAEKNTDIQTEFNATPDVILTDLNATKQVLLNLCFNAIQAQENQDGVRWVRIETVKRRNGIELQVSDNGPGIAAEMRSKLFETFQTTKSSGFGLGLAVCNEILTGLNAVISVDPYSQGSGAVFRVLFPCPQPSS